MLTAEQITARKEQLQADLKKIESDYNATAGAIQDCDYWLSVLNGGVAEMPPLLTVKE
jgi:hypothetical protein